MQSNIRLTVQNILVAVFVLGLCATARAQFTNVAYDGFNYSAGTLNNQNGGAGWTGAWTNGYTSGSSLQVSATGMSYTGLTNSGGSAVWVFGGNGISEASRTLPLQSSGVVYVRFLSQFGSTSGAGTPNLRLLNSGALTGGFGGNGGTYGAYMSILNNSLNAAANGSSSSTAALSATNLVLARIDYQSNLTTMWVNPNLATFNYQNPATPPSATYTNLAPVFNAIDLVTRNPANVDEITIFAEPDQTPPPVLTSPLAGSANGGPGILISYTLPTTPLAGSVQLLFTNNSQSLTLTLTNATNVSFLLLPHNPQASPNVISTTPVSGTLPDGLYTVQLSYQDTNADPAASAIATNVLVDTVTQPPVLLAPVTSAVVNSAGLHLSYQLPEAPLSGSVLMIFYNSSTNIVLSLNNSQTNDFTVPTASLTNAPAVNSASASALPDGIYSVQLMYEDALGNPAASAGVTNVLVDTITLPPMLLTPANSAVVSSAGLHIQYLLPETPGSGSVVLTFTNSNTNISLFLNNSLANDFTIPTASLLASPAVTSASASALPDGVYTAQLSYQDAVGNPAASAGVTNVLVDTVTLPPVLLAPVTSAVVSSTGLHISYNLPEAPGSGSVSLIFQNSSNTVTLHLNNSQANDFTMSPSLLTGDAAVTAATPTALPDGRYAVALAYQDALFNPAALVQATNVLVVLEPLYFNPTSLTYSNGLFQFNFTNSLPAGLGFTYNVLSSSNVDAPLTNWVDLGPAVETPPGHFQFQDLRSNNPVEFYLLRLN